MTSSNYGIDSIIATAIVWDYTDTHVLLLTNYHTWDTEEFQYCFPPKTKDTKKNTKHNKRKLNEDDPVKLKLHNEDDFNYEFTVTSDLFYKCNEEDDFAILKLPKVGFTMSRIPVWLGISLTMKVHAFGYIGHTGKFNVSNGEVSGLITDGFATTILSAEGYSGSAIIADGNGRAIGYMGGNLDASKDKNSQHQSYCFRFDPVIRTTSRKTSPVNSPDKNTKPK